MPRLLDPRPVSFVIQGKQFAGELWGNDSAMPVIALHGWLDNCHSFRPMAPHLESIQLLALDMAGHGHSEHRSADASYHIWDDVREILMIANEMGWQQFSLLGHSRGAIIATLIAAVAPERIQGMVLLEGIWPQTMTEQEAPAQLTSFVQRYLSFDGVEKGYKNLDDMVHTRMQGAFALNEPAARLLVERNMEARDGFYYWRTDPRLLMPSPVMLTVKEVESFINTVQCQSLLLVASEGLGKNIDFLRPKLDFRSGLAWACLEGGHHLHLEGSVHEVAERISHFLYASRKGSGL
jgi:pimeloyl-ACP methyl ester carboxylesterase